MLLKILLILEGLTIAAFTLLSIAIPQDKSQGILLFSLQALICNTPYQSSSLSPPPLQGAVGCCQAQRAISISQAGM